MWDLAEAHVAAVEQFDQALAKVDSPGTIINLGTGDGVTVRELVAAFEKVFGKPVPVREAGPRPAAGSAGQRGAGPAADETWRLVRVRRTAERSVDV